jgi:hypothetical protein
VQHNFIMCRINICVRVVSGRYLTGMIQIQGFVVKQNILHNGVGLDNPLGVRCDRVDKVIDVKTVDIGLRVTGEGVIPVGLPLENQLVAMLHTDKAVVQLEILGQAPEDLLTFELLYLIETQHALYDKKKDSHHLKDNKIWKFKSKITEAP